MSHTTQGLPTQPASPYSEIRPLYTGTGSAVSVSAYPFSGKEGREAAGMGQGRVAYPSRQESYVVTDSPRERR
jgi:hypothetical protein